MPSLNQEDPPFTDEDKKEFNNDILIKESYKLMINTLLCKYGYRLTNHYVHHINEKIIKWKGKEETITTLNKIKNSISEIYGKENIDFTDTLQLLETIIIENTKPIPERKTTNAGNIKLSISTSSYNSNSENIENNNNQMSILNFYRGKSELNGKTIDQYLILVGKELLQDIDFYTNISVYIMIIIIYK